MSQNSDWIRIWQAPLLTFLTTLGHRIAFAIGWTTLMVTTYRLRPHWMLLWLLAALYPALKWRRGETIRAWELALAGYVLGYIGPVILVADIAGYGGRMVAMILPLVAVFAVRTVDLALTDPDRS